MIQILYFFTYGTVSMNCEIGCIDLKIDEGADQNDKN